MLFGVYTTGGPFEIMACHDKRPSYIPSGRVVYIRVLFPIAMWFCSCRITKYGHAQLYCDNSQEMHGMNTVTQLPIHRHYDGQLSNHRSHHSSALGRHCLLEVFILQIIFLLEILHSVLQILHCGFYRRDVVDYRE